jgi:hypothetical protein
MTYFDEGPGWALCTKVDIGKLVMQSHPYLPMLMFLASRTCRFIPYPINDSIWLTSGSLLLAAGHQMFLYGTPLSETDSHTETLFEYVARQNGPLEDYHPQMLLQCLLWGWRSSSCELHLLIEVFHRKSRAGQRDHREFGARYRKIHRQ